MMRKVFFAALAALMMASSANAAVIVGLLLNPASTAGVATSNRSGAGTWQLYAIEDAQSSDFGISSYSITMTGQTAINHRSTTGSEVNSDGDTQPFGFGNLRSGTNVNPIVAAEPLPTANPIAPPLILGFGQTANTANAAILAIDPGATGIAATTGASWGTYNSSALTGASLAAAGQAAAASAVNAGRKWLFIAEGTSTPNIGVTSFTVYSNQIGASVATPSSVVTLSESTVPEPATLSLLGLAMVGGIGAIRRRRA